MTRSLLPQLGRQEPQGRRGRRADSGEEFGLGTKCGAAQGLPKWPQGRCLEPRSTALWLKSQLLCSGKTSPTGGGPVFSVCTQGRSCELECLFLLSQGSPASGGPPAGASSLTGPELHRCSWGTWFSPRYPEHWAGPAGAQPCSSVLEESWWGSWAPSPFLPQGATPGLPAPPPHPGRSCSLPSQPQLQQRWPWRGAWSLGGSGDRQWGFHLPLGP